MPTNPPAGTCPTSGKYGYSNRLSAESALDAARSQWRKFPRRAEQPPERVYRCPHCDMWHLTHQELRART